MKKTKMIFISRNIGEVCVIETFSFKEILNHKWIKRFSTLPHFIQYSLLPKKDLEFYFIVENGWSDECIGVLKNFEFNNQIPLYKKDRHALNKLKGGGCMWMDCMSWG